MYLSAIETLICRREMSLTLYLIMPILGSSISVANKRYDGKNMGKWGYNYLLE